MKITIDTQEYWTRREFLPHSVKPSDVALPPEDCQAIQTPGGKWVRCEHGIALYCANRADILAIPAVREYLNRRKLEHDQLTSEIGKRTKLGALLGQRL